MNELKMISTDSMKPTMSGRVLHKQLEITTPYHKWFPRMCEYGFVENQDYSTLDGQKSPTNNPKNPWTIVTDHQLSLEMAKEICMLQRTDKGRAVRRYLIEVEEQWNTPEVVISRALIMSNSKCEQLTVSLKAVQAQLEEAQPKVIMADAISGSPDSILVGDLAKLLKQNGVNVGQNRLFKDLRESNYLIKSGVSKNVPTQYALEHGWMEVKETPVYMRSGEVKIQKTPLVTGEGQKYFLNKFLAKGCTVVELAQENKEVRQ